MPVGRYYININVFCGHKKLLIMKKTFLLFFAACTFFMVGCEKDNSTNQTPNDSVPSDDLTPEQQILTDPSYSSLAMNQALVGSSAVDVEVTLAVRPAQQYDSYTDPGAHYVDLVALDSSFSIRMDLGTPNLGKYINLVAPLASVGENQFSIMITTSDGYYSLDAGGETFSSMTGDESFDGTSCFTSGMFYSAHTITDDFTLNMAATLKGGKKVAVKVHLPETEVTYW